jgi:Dynamin family
MDELRTYADRRLELGDMVRAALHLARGLKDAQAENRARDLLSRLAGDTFQLAVAGQFSRGKTTLMNALLGGPYLPMGALPMTSVITTVRYGSRPKAIVRRRASGLGAEVPLAQVAAYIAQASATRAEQQVVSAEVEVPAEILRLGFEFIDTPGVGSAIEIAGRIEAGLPGLLAARSSDWQSRLLELLAPLAEAALPAGAMDGPVRDLLEKARAGLERAGREVISGWLERRTGEVLEMVTGMVAGEVGSLLELARSPGVAGAEIAGLADEDDRGELAGWSAEDVPDLAIRPPAWIVHVEQPRRSWRRAGPGGTEVRDRLGAALAASVDAFTDAARTAFADAAREWASRLDEQAALQMRRAADWFRQCVRTVPSDEDLAAADSLMARLAAFQAALEGAGPPPAEAVTVTPAGRPDIAAEGCAVCKQMEQALTSHLFTGQFRLATREDEQERHILDGGFCPLHTWQYASVASPLGISAGYAKLAASVADALESLSRQDSTAADLARGVAALTTEPGKCPVCAALADRERTAIAGLISQIRPATAALCLRHLALALSAGLDAGAAQASLHTLAATLRRDSEDMRAYALKREAYHSALVTAEESRAHLDALHRLAGPPALTQPWTDQEVIASPARPARGSLR